jgi:hypothetical protein
MKILCSKSGIQFEVSHFPFSSSTNLGVSHPVFQLPQKKLLSLVPKWAGGEFTEVDSYLYFLALLDSTDLVEFRHPCKVTAETSSIVYNNMEDLIQIIGQMNLIQHPAAIFQRIAISPENNTLQNVHYWIENWETNLKDFSDGYQTFSERMDLNRREAALEKLIKSPYKEIQLATQIANWAEIAGQFPQFQVSTQFGTLECNEYWKLIIRKCINSESIFSIPLADIQELIEHCENTIEHGSIYAHTLMEILRNGATKNKNFLGLGDWDLSQSSINYLIVSEDSVEKANLDLLVATAPTSEPRITDYPTKFEYLKAKSKWMLATQMNASTAKQESIGGL